MILPKLSPFNLVRSLALGIVVFASGFTAVLPAAAAPLSQAVDTEVVVLFVPLCLLMLALVAEAARLALAGHLVARPAPVRRPPSLGTRL